MKGTLILTAAALIARVLGAVQRIPLVYLLGDSGMGSYTIAFNVYSMLLVVATAGIPSALSKLISERTALGRQAEANRIYRAAVQFALVSGAVMTVLLFAAAPYYAVHVAHDPVSTAAIRAIAPALLLFPLIAIMRGYFQGRQHMMPNGLSQIVEQILRLVAAIGLAYAFVRLGYGDAWAIAGASFGGVMGSVGAVAVMLYFAWKLRKADRAEALAAGAGQTPKGRAPGQKSGHPSPEHAASVGPAETLSYRRIFSMIFRISIPIVVFSMTVTLIYFIDSSIVIPLLEGQVGAERAKEILGVLGGRAQSLAGIPIILAVALSQSVVPIVSAAYARGDMEQLSRQSSRALQLSIVTGLPMVVAICAAARSINIFMFGDDEGTSIIVVMTVSSLFQIVMQTSGAILMGLGDAKKLIAYVVIGIAIKLAGSFLLAPWFGIYGIIASTALCFVAMSQLNLSALRRKVSYAILGRRWLGMAATTVVSAAVGAGLEYALHDYAQVPLFGARISAGIHAVLSGAAMLGAYVLLLIVTRVVTRDDAAGLPAPLRKLFGRLPGMEDKLPGRSGGNG